MWLTLTILVTFYCYFLTKYTTYHAEINTNCLPLNVANFYNYPVDSLLQLLEKVLSTFSSYYLLTVDKKIYALKKNKTDNKTACTTKKISCNGPLD